MVMRQNLITTFVQMFRSDKKLIDIPNLILLILICLVLRKCIFNRLLIIRFVCGFDTLRNVILKLKLKKNIVTRFRRVTIDILTDICKW